MKVPCPIRSGLNSRIFDTSADFPLVSAVWIAIFNSLSRNFWRTGRNSSKLLPTSGSPLRSIPTIRSWNFCLVSRMALKLDSAFSRFCARSIEGRNLTKISGYLIWHLRIVSQILEMYCFWNNHNNSNHFSYKQYSLEQYIKFYLCHKSIFFWRAA